MAKSKSSSSLISVLCAFAFVRDACVLLVSLIFIRSAESFQFINTTDVVRVVLEFNKTAVNQSISCRTDDPNASTTLFFNFQEQPVGGRISLDNQVYTIYGVKKTDAGYYQCKATSSQAGVGPIESKIMIFVVDEEMTPCCPDIYPSSAILRPGENTSFACHVKMRNDGHFVSLEQYLDFAWYRKNGSSYVKISDSETRRYNDSCSLLMIKNAKVTPVGGVYYHCEIFYRGNRTKHSKTIEVGLVVQDFAARIEYCKVDGGSSVVREPNGVDLRCKADGYPLATIRWFHNGTEIPVCKKETSSTGCAGGRYQVEEDRNRKFAYVESYLMIKNTKYPRDHGNYTCVANNSELQNATKDVEIFVYSPPTLDKIREIWYSTTVIDCKVSRTNPLPTFRWQHQSGLCLNDNRECKPSDSKWQNVSAPFSVSPAVDVATGVSKLTFPQNLQSAFFRCVATNAMGSDDYVMRFLGGSYDKQIKIIARSLEHDEGNTMTLRCVMFWKGSMITWHKDGEQLSHATDRRVNISSTVRAHLTRTHLVVKRVATNDSGEYTCGAEDDSGQHCTDSINITIKTQLPRHFVLIPNKSIYVLQGQSGEVTCEAEGPSVSTLEWEKQLDDKSYAAVPNSQVNITKDANYVRATLKITNAQFADTGTYKCTLSVPPNLSDYKLTKIEVKAPSAPKISPYTEKTEILEGSTKAIKCVAEGYPKPTVDWYRNGKKMNVTNCHSNPQSLQSCDKVDYEVYEEGDGSSGLHTIYTVQVLKIRSALYPRDAGEFKCVASNGVSPDAELIVSLDVQVDLVKRLKLRPPENISVLQGQEARIKCDLDGSLTAELEWKKQTISADVPVPERMVTVVKDSSNNRARAILKIKFAQMEDNGVYKCVSTLYGKTHVKLAYVTVRESLAFLNKPPRVIRGRIGQSVVINCSTNDVDAKVSLLRKPHPFAPSTELKPKANKLTKERQVFTIQNIDIGDAGIYSCGATSGKNQTIKWPRLRGYFVFLQ